MRDIGTLRAPQGARVNRSRLDRLVHRVARRLLRRELHIAEGRALGPGLVAKRAALLQPLRPAAEPGGWFLGERGARGGGGLGFGFIR